MKPRTLYPVLLLSVLLLAGCRSNSSSRTSSETPDTTASLRDTTTAGEKRILVMGNSIAAGYGLSSDQAFPALLQQKIDALGWNVEVVNAGNSGETSAGGLGRIEWLLRQPVDVLLLELGANDGLRGIDTDVTKENLAAIIDSTRTRYPDARVVLAGMKVPPNLGHEYTERFQEIYPELADEKDATLIPFLLEDVGGVDTLNQADGIHPTARGQRIVAQNVWTHLKPVLADLRRPQTADAEDCAADDEAFAVSDTSLQSLEAYAASGDSTAADCAE